MRYFKYILLAFLLMGMTSLAMATDKSGDTKKSDNKSAAQKAAKDAAKDIGAGANNLINAIKQMPSALGKASKKITDKKDKKDGK